MATKNGKLPWISNFVGDRFLSSAGTGRNFGLSMRVPNPSPVLDKNPAPMGQEIFSSTEAGVWRKAPKAFPDSSSAPDKFQSAILGQFLHLSSWGLLSIWISIFPHFPISGFWAFSMPCMPGRIPILVNCLSLGVQICICDLIHTLRLKDCLCPAFLTLRN